MERLLQARLGEGYSVTSAGVSARPGAGMHEFSAEEIERFGGFNGDFVSTRLTQNVIASADLIVTANRAIRESILELDPAALKRTFTLLELAVVADVLVSQGETVSNPSQLLRTASARRSDVGLSYHTLDIPDPIGQKRKVHAEVGLQIANAVDRIAEVLPDALGEHLLAEPVQRSVPAAPLRDPLATQSARTYVRGARLSRLVARQR